jgi:NitT/TauT family transport system substrate-binding protein
MMKRICGLILAATLASVPIAAQAEVSELRIPLGAGGFGFLPLHMMKEHKLIEKHSAAAGVPVTVNWANIGGPSVMNEALLSGSADFISAGPPAFLTLWDRTRGTPVEVKAAAGMSSMPMYLNTSAEHLKSLDDIKAEDKIAVTAVKVSIPSIIMQMHALQKYGKDQAFRFDRNTVSMTHPDGVIAMLTGNKQITAHYTSPPFHHREIKEKNIRTIQTTSDVMGGSTTFTMISTTERFQKANPKVFGAFLAALKESMQMIASDKKGAAAVLLASMGGKGWEIDELVAILDDKDIKYTTAPENVMKYAEFMNSIGTLKNKPASWKELFFPEMHDQQGN